MVATDHCKSIPQDEQDAVGAFFDAVERLEPYGYHVYYLSPEDALGIAPHLTRAAACAAIHDNRDQWVYLSDCDYSRDLIREVFAERGVLPGIKQRVKYDDDD